MRREAAMESINLSSATLIGANLRNAILSGANLSGKNLTGANLRNAILSGANLSGANLSSATLIGGDLSYANLSGANLSSATLIGGDLSYANLSGANLSDANLSIVDLCGANLSDANLCNTNLYNVNLACSILSRVSLQKEVPVVANIDAAIFAAIKIPGHKLDMGSWHTCKTTHCRAGWAVTLAGEAGAALENEVGPVTAGALIYGISRPDKRVPDFYAGNEATLIDLQACAAESQDDT